VREEVKQDMEQQFESETVGELKVRDTSWGESVDRTRRRVWVKRYPISHLRPE
jgi:hypothetical protein